MRRIVALGAGACLVAALGFSLAAQEKPPESYVTMMKGMQAHLGGASMAMRGKDAAAVAKHAAEMQPLFEEAAKFWEDRKAQDAVDAAQAGRKAAGELEAAAKAENEEQMTAARKGIIDSCSSCHDAHREKLPDGTWAIK
ncbi:MAG TPA: hypothetical protein VND92_10935 [Vicinamibacterales bacterium]|nr:hypothetical protein [Vicinamibacterales bacterium]